VKRREQAFELLQLASVDVAIDHGRLRPRARVCTFGTFPRLVGPHPTASAPEPAKLDRGLFSAYGTLAPARPSTLLLKTQRLPGFSLHANTEGQRPARESLIRATIGKWSNAMNFFWVCF
jgi:hypothetical protein